MKKLTKKMASEISILINGLECAKIMLEQKDKKGNYKFDRKKWMAAYNRDARQLIELGIKINLYRSIEEGEY